MGFWIRALVSGMVIAYTSWLAGKKPALAGFIVSLPLISMFTILFSYLQYKDMQRINQFAISILLAVPLSLSFFLPFVLNKWLKMHFALTYFLAFACLVAAYLIHNFLFKTIFR